MRLETLIYCAAAVSQCETRQTFYRTKVCRTYISFITGCNEVVTKVMFLLVSVILLTGGSASVHAGIPPPLREACAPRKHASPWEASTPPEACTPLQKQAPSRKHAHPHPPGIPSMNGRYASYWNAFLFMRRIFVVTRFLLRGSSSKHDKI